MLVQSLPKTCQHRSPPVRLLCFSDLPAKTPMMRSCQVRNLHQGSKRIQVAERLRSLFLQDDPHRSLQI
ncbi:MAG: hypothetical protein ACK53Y_05880, partial [bacterium]